MNKEEKRAIEKFRKLGIKKFREEKLTNEDLLSYFEFVIILNLIEKLQKENQTLKSFVSGIFNENIEKDFIQVQKVKDKIIHYQELQDNFILEVKE